MLLELQVYHDTQVVEPPNLITDRRLPVADDCDAFTLLGAAARGAITLVGARPIPIPLPPETIPGFIGTAVDKPGPARPGPPIALRVGNMLLPLELLIADEIARLPRVAEDTDTVLSAPVAGAGNNPSVWSRDGSTKFPLLSNIPYAQEPQINIYTHIYSLEIYQ